MPDPSTIYVDFRVIAFFIQKRGDSLFLDQRSQKPFENGKIVFFAPPPDGGVMVLATSKKTEDKELPLGAYPPKPGGWVWW